MTRIPRSALPETGYFHAYSRGARGLPIFVDDADRHALARLLRRCEKRHGWTCHAFTVLTTHYHVVLEATQERLSAGFHELNGRYAQRFNRRYEGEGHVFAERFGARVIEDEDYLFDVCNYVVMNPVKAGLCARPEDWPWSFSCYGV